MSCLSAPPFWALPSLRATKPLLLEEEHCHKPGEEETNYAYHRGDQRPGAQAFAHAHVQILRQNPEKAVVDVREAEAAKAEALAWENAIKAIQENRVTPVELEEIIKRVEQNNPRATEIYAWMLTKGVGVKQNLIKAFQLYQQAAKLGVLNAENNAAQIYRVLSPDERAFLAQNS